MRRRRNAGHVVGEDRPEARARLDPRIPFLGGLVCLPRHVAEIVEARQLGRGGDVGDREMVAGQPAPALDEIPDVVEVVRQVGMPGADRLRIRLSLAEIALHHLLAEQVLGDLEVHLDVEPGGQAPHFGPVDRVDADQDLLAIDLVEIFDDRRRVGEHGPVRLDQHRHLAGRVEGEEFRPPFPDLLRLQREVEVLLSQHDAHLARAGREPEVIEDAHAADCNDQRRR